uniref:Uncharacterized protein n=1 Tax=Anopheles coluzzii TaxID=1518534 RepID=A0A8W7PEP7_ANOCL
MIWTIFRQKVYLLPSLWSLQSTDIESGGLSCVQVESSALLHSKQRMASPIERCRGVRVLFARIDYLVQIIEQLNRHRVAARIVLPVDRTQIYHVRSYQVKIGKLKREKTG